MLRLSLLANCSASVLCFVSVLFDCHFLVDSWSSFLCPSSALSLRLPSSTFVAAFSDRRAHSHFTSSSFVHLWQLSLTVERTLTSLRLPSSTGRLVASCCVRRELVSSVGVMLCPPSARIVSLCRPSVCYRHSLAAKCVCRPLSGWQVLYVVVLCK